MQLGELVAVMVSTDDPDECPFIHSAKKHTQKNKVPPPSTVNNASTLSDNLDTATLGVPPTPITLPRGEKSMAQFTAHHLIPGNEAWPKSKLYRWIDKRKGHVKGDIGYDVNDYRNGVDVPGHTPIGNWTSRSPKFRADYAYAAMKAAGGTRQFHDRHAAYSDFVIAALNKIAAKLDGKPQGGKGCGDEDCPGNGKKPFDPPYALLDRLHSLASNLSGKLKGDSRKWKSPIYTSRFALMYRQRDLSEDEARKHLKTDNFNY